MDDKRNTFKSNTSEHVHSRKGIFLHGNINATLVNTNLQIKFTDSFDWIYETLTLDLFFSEYPRKGLLIIINYNLKQQNLQIKVISLYKIVCSTISVLSSVMNKSVIQSVWYNHQKIIFLNIFLFHPSI